MRDGHKVSPTTRITTDREEAVVNANSRNGGGGKSDHGKSIHRASEPPETMEKIPPPDLQYLERNKMRESNDQKLQVTLMSEEKARTTTSLQIDATSGHSSRCALRLAPPVQDDYQVKSNSTDMTKAQSHGSAEMKVAALHQPDALRREESRELAYQQKMKLAQANSNTANMMKSPSYGSSEMKVAAMHQSDALRREESRELAFQEKMKLAQAHPYRPAQGSSTLSLTLVPGAKSTTNVRGPDSPDKKIQALVLQDKTRLLPGPSLSLAHGLSSSTANLKTDPDDEMRMAKRASVERRKSQELGMTTSASDMPRQDQRPSQKGEGLCLAPARAVSQATTMMPSPDDVAHRPEPWRQNSDQALHDEKRRMMEGSQGHSSGKQFHESFDWEKEAAHAGNRPSSSYLPSRMQVDNNSNRARGTQDTLAKHMLLIDPRAAPQEHTTNVEGISVIESSPPSSMENELTAAHAGATSSNTSLEPPSRRVRTPAEGYTVRAGNKGPRDHSTTPGAIAVVQRALGARPEPRSRADSNDSLDVLDDSMMSYSATAEGINRSTRGDALSSSGVPGSENARSVWVAHCEESYSNLPPEMRELAMRQQAALFGSSVVDGTIKKRQGISKTICMIIATLVLAIALGTGLGVGLGGKDDPSPGTETAPPALPLNTSYFQSLVEDFYKDEGGLVFEDTKSPQYQALVWLASDAQSESLGDERIRTLYALAVFYYTTNGDDFLSFPTWNERFGFLNSTTDNICQWNNGDRISIPKGLWCDSSGTKVERLYFSTNNLVGVIPEEIGMLKDLQYFLVAGNRLSSTLPESLFALSTLKGVDLNLNSFSGVLPTTFYKATSLEVLHFGSNALYGPFSVDHIVESVFCPLQLVVLAGNTFSGTFPLESIAANCTDMTTININDCGVFVEGSLPPFGLEKMTLLDLTKSELGGSIPDEISRLRRLQQLKADHNALTGTLPESLGELVKLTDLSLGSNTIKGTIPSTLGELRQLTSLVLESNILEGTVPVELANCTNLVDVKLHMNTLSGDMDFLCPLNLEKSSSDCTTGAVVCTCCTECY